eukprot:TRINITY_DN19699_c0_g1_i1.p1 TRINITY_DN19699_c0_g1~~TRINITY_DN19699_c0_g1_i1.p1  ORF type:complete len:1477 (+),score=286.27 TRINITY_DN19699_c0_g1_i1:96-4526(+)
MGCGASSQPGGHEHDGCSPASLATPHTGGGAGHSASSSASTSASPVQAGARNAACFDVSPLVGKASTDSPAKCLVVFVLGGPGAGKGTQCARIAETFGYRHFSVGDLLRTEQARVGSDLGERIRRSLEAGSLAASEDVVKLIEQAMSVHGMEGKFVIDGFPRSFENLKVWNECFNDGRVKVKNFLYLEASQGAMEERRLADAMMRGLDASEEAETLRRKFRTFHSESVPVIEHYRTRGLLKRVNADLDVEQVWQQVQAFFGPEVVFAVGAEGAGKSTQCQRIAQTFGYTHLAVDSWPDYAGADPQTVLQMIRRSMLETGWEGGKYVIEGFPRDHADWQAWLDALHKFVAFRFCIHFDASEMCMEARQLYARYQSESHGAKAAPTSSISDSIHVFQAQSLPILERLKLQGKLRVVDAEQDADLVWAATQTLFGPEVVFVIGAPGAGKQRQCIRVSKMSELGYKHLRVEEVFAPDPQSSATVLTALEKAMREHGWDDGRYIIEGFPRDLKDLELWQKRLMRKAIVKFAICMECEESVSLQRVVDEGRDVSGFNILMERWKESSEPLKQKLRENGNLRVIDSGQSVDDIWSCVNEVMHMELNPEITNRALMFIKPHAATEEVTRFVQSRLALHRVQVLRAGSTSLQEVADRELFDLHYCHHVAYAHTKPEDMNLPAAAKTLFSAHFGLDWDEAVRRGEVESAAAAAAASSPEELYNAWNSSDGCKLGPRLHCRRIATGRFVVNGFIPFWRSSFLEQSNPVKWFIVQFHPAQVNWKTFREDILGTTDPATAPPESVRGQIYAHWKELGLPSAPSMLQNAVHASAGPLEGLRECMVWTGDCYHDVPLSRMMLAAGVSALGGVIEQWMEDPVITDWPVGHEVCSGRLFDLTQHCDTSLFIRSAVRYVLAHGGLTPTAVTAQLQGYDLFGHRRGLKHEPRNAASNQGPKTSALTFLHFNDVYNVEARDKEPCGGVARFVTKVKELKAAAVARGEPEAICVFSGDAFNPAMTSSITKGKHMVPALNAVGIEVAVFGNHDFDHGLPELHELAAATQFPWLCSNVRDKTTGLPLGNGEMSLIREVGGRKIGYIGLVEQEWMVTLGAINPEDIEYEDFCTCGRWLARDLRSQGAELVIALTHMRMPNDYLLASEVEEIDIIFGGHDHHYECAPYGPYGTYILNSGTDFRDMTELRITFGQGESSKAFKVTSTQHVEITADIPEDVEMRDMVMQCQLTVGKSMEEVIGQSAVDLDSRFASIRTAETNIGNFVADVMRQRLDSDVAIINSGTLRADCIIQAGAFRMKDLVSLLPMMGELCVLRLSGADLLNVLQNSVSQYPRFEGRFLQVSGVQFTFDAEKPGGQRVLPDTVCVNNELLDLAGYYSVCTTDYLRAGKDGFDVLKTAACLRDGEQAGVLPTVMRSFFSELMELNGEAIKTRSMSAHSEVRASRVLPSLTRVGEGPDPLRHYAINPAVEGRIKCLNPALLP